MEITWDQETCRVTIAFSTREEVGHFIDQAQKQKGFMISLDAAPKPFETYALLLAAAGSFEFSFKATLVHVFERSSHDFDAAFQLTEWKESKDLELKRKLSAAQPGAASESESRGTSPVFRVKQMNVSEKMRLAMKANRGERKILCRDNSPQVLMGLLANPRIEAEDVLQIVKSTHASPDILQRVAKDKKWTSNQEIRTAVVRNPKTPVPFAVRLLESLRTNDLRDMAKMGALRESVRKAALSVYLKRTSRT